MTLVTLCPWTEKGLSQWNEVKLINTDLMCVHGYKVTRLHLKGGLLDVLDGIKLTAKNEDASSIFSGV